MKTKEMRVGNYYINKEDGLLYKIQASDMISLNYIEEDDDLYIPIPLTKEIFYILTYSHIHCCVGTKYAEIEILDQSFTFTRRIYSTFNSTEAMFDRYNLGNIYHLHQLQNLYYTMTRWELPIDFDKLKEYVKTIEL